MLIGCVYIDPTDKPGGDADISWWVRDEYVGTDVERALDELVPRWIDEEWPAAGTSVRRARHLLGRTRIALPTEDAD